METKIIHRHATFDKMSFTLVLRFPRKSSPCWFQVQIVTKPLSPACQMSTLATALMPSSFHSMLPLSLQNLELLIPESIFTKFSSSVQAYMNATEMPMTKIPKSLQLAAYANKYFMKEVSGVPANKVVPELLGHTQS